MRPRETWTRLLAASLSVFAVLVSGVAFAALPSISTTPVFHVDASDQTTLTTTVSGDKTLVDKWVDADGRSVNAYSSGNNRPYLDSFNGKTVVNFGPFAGDTAHCWLKWTTRDTSVRESFIVYNDCSGSASGFFFGDYSSCYHYHRGGTTSYFYSGCPNAVKNATIEVNGKAITWNTAPPSGFHILHVRTTGNTTISSFALDRSCRSGGVIIAEAVIFNGVLSDADSASVYQYLYDKWFGCAVVVTGSPEEYGKPSPGYGRTDLTAGETKNFTANGTVEYLNDAETIRGKVTGYRVDTFDTLADTWTEGSVVSGASYAHTQVASELKRLVWQWSVDCKTTLSATEGGSVSVAEGWTARGGTFTATATPESGYTFYCWTGDVSNAVDITSATLSLTNIAAPCAITAQFRKTGLINPDPHGGDDYATITTAIDDAEAGDTIEFGPGTFHISNTITISKQITLKGAGMNETIFMPTKSGYRGFYVDGNSVVEDLQANGFVGAGSYSYYGVGFYLKRGKAKSCRATANRGGSLYANGTGFYLDGYYSGGVACATNCVSDHNIPGGGTVGTGFYLSWGCSVYNSLAYENQVTGNGTQGGAIYVHRNGRVYNSTVVGTKSNGGIYMEINYGGLVTNCVSALNNNYFADLCGPDAPDIGVSDPAITNCIKCCVAGRFAELRDPANGDYRLRPARAALTKAGYYAYDPTEDALDFAADDPYAFVGTEVTLRAVQTGKYAGKALTWSATDPDGAACTVTGTNPAKLKPTKQGRYSVTLTAAGEAPCVREDYLYVRNRTNELAVTGVTDELPAAVSQMIDGETLLLGEGTYPTTVPVYMTNHVTIVGKGWEKTIIKKTGSRGVILMSAAQSHLTGCTVTGGAAGDYYNISGSGVRITGDGGKVSWCNITGNKRGTFYTDGLGVGMCSPNSANTIVTHCIISNNLGSVTADAGGGVNMKYGILENCLIVNNTAKNGGGIYVHDGSGRIRNCTIAKNTAGATGGGISGYRPYGNYVLTNCILAENTADSDTGAGGKGKPNWSTTEAGVSFNASAFSYCAIGTPSTVLNTNTSISVNAPFVDSANNDFHLEESSKAMNGGTNYADMAAVDLDYMPRISGKIVDMGCYEVDLSKMSCSFEVDPTVGFTSVPLTCTPTVINPPEGETLGYTWTFTDGNGNESVFSGESPYVSISVGGIYTVRLDVYKTSEPDKILCTKTRANLVRLACRTVYAVGGGVNPTMAEPFDTWETAHTNLNELETYLIDGCEVVLGEGDFIITNHLVLAGDIQYHGSGRDLTFIQCKNCRGFHLNNKAALVENLTVVGGNAWPCIKTGGYQEPGLGILVDSSGGVVRNCRVTGCYNSSWYQRGAIAVCGIDGYVSHCIVDHNKSSTGGNSYSGIYITQGHVDNCLVYSNASTAAGGLATAGIDRQAWVSNCTFTANTATSDGSGGLRYVFASYGPNYDIVNCIFSGNKGVFRETTPTGGGQFDTNELDFVWSGGYHWGDNKVAAEKLRYVLKNCCFTFLDPEAAVGTETINDDPKFLDPSVCDYRLYYRHCGDHSPAADSGRFGPWMIDATDLDGRPRSKRVYRDKSNGLVDMGCYEATYGDGGFIFILR